MQCKVFFIWGALSLQNLFQSLTLEKQSVENIQKVTVIVEAIATFYIQSMLAVIKRNNALNGCMTNTQYTRLQKKNEMKIQT